MAELRTNTISHPAPTLVALQLNGETSMTEIMRAMRMIRGIDGVHEVKGRNVVTPALKKRIACAEKNFREGKTIKFHSVEEMDAYLDAL